MHKLALRYVQYQVHKLALRYVQYQVHKFAMRYICMHIYVYIRKDKENQYKIVLVQNKKYAVHHKKLLEYGNDMMSYQIDIQYDYTVCCHTVWKMQVLKINSHGTFKIYLCRSMFRNVCLHIHTLDFTRARTHTHHSERMKKEKCNEK